MLFGLGECALMAIRCLALLLCPQKGKLLDYQSVPYILKIVPVSLFFTWITMQYSCSVSGPINYDQQMRQVFGIIMRLVGINLK